MRSTTGLYALILGAACLVAVPAANAQNQSPSAPPAASPPATTSPGTTGKSSPSAAIPDQKLDATAAAVKTVTAVKQNYEQKVAEAPASDKARITDEANAAMVQAVTDQGLTLEEYTSILQVAQNNPTVKEKILQRLK